MENIRIKIRLIKSRISYIDVYMYLFEDLYWGKFIDKRRYCYYILNVANIDKILPVLYNNKFITYDNIENFIANFYEYIEEWYYFSYCNENYFYDTWFKTVLNKYYTKQSLAFEELVKVKPEFKNLLTDIEKELSDYILNLDFMYSMLHPASVIYTLADKYTYTDVVPKLKEYMIDEGIAIPINSFLENDLLKPNKSIVREFKKEELFSERIKVNSQELDYWTDAVYAALINDKDMNDMYSQNKLTNTYIDYDIIEEDYIAEFQYPLRKTSGHDKDKSKVVLIDNEDLGDLDDFFGDEDADDE